jgi:hypothetical protein
MSASAGFFQPQSFFAQLIGAIEYLLGAYSDEFFARYMTRPLATIMVTLWTPFLLLVFLIGAAVGIGVTAERLYLLTAGVSTMADITGSKSYYVSSNTGTRRGYSGSSSSPIATTPRLEIAYTFTTRDGEKISNRVARDPKSLSDTPRGQIEVYYAAWWPQLNLPRQAFDDVDNFLLYALLFLALIHHPWFTLRRYWAWRKARRGA